MLPHQRLAVFDALMLKAYASHDVRSFPDELEAFQVFFRRRRFRMLLTTEILDQYQREANNAPQFLLQPVLSALDERGTTIHRDEYHLNRGPIEITGLPKRHPAFIRDSVGAGASYFITKYQPWLNLSEQTQANCGLIIATPAHFVFLEG